MLFRSHRAPPRVLRPRQPERLARLQSRLRTFVEQDGGEPVTRIVGTLVEAKKLRGDAVLLVACLLVGHCAIPKRWHESHPAIEKQPRASHNKCLRFSIADLLIHRQNLIFAFGNFILRTSEQPRPIYLYRG